MIIRYIDHYSDLPLLLNFNQVYRIEVQAVSNTREQEFGAYRIGAIMPDGTEVLYYGTKDECVDKFDEIEDAAIHELITYDIGKERAYEIQRVSEDSKQTEKEKEQGANVGRSKTSAETKTRRALQSRRLDR